MQTLATDPQMQTIKTSAHLRTSITQEELTLTQHQQQHQHHQKHAAMAAIKSVLPLVLLIVLAAQNHLVVESQPQSACSTSLSTLNVCAPFVVPGANSNPSSDCCGALQAVDHDCLCSTLRIASRIPVQCNLPPLSCAN